LVAVVLSWYEFDLASPEIRVPLKLLTRLTSNQRIPGWKITMVRVFASGFIQMGVFESLKKFIRELDVSPPPPKAKVGWEHPL
jgi:hypothetical protein